MSTLPSYKAQEDKIIQAYFKDEIKPMDVRFCICGTLVPISKDYYSYNTWETDLYSMWELKRIETALMVGLKAEAIGNSWHSWSHKPDQNDYEDRLFEGMVAALEVLKTIHQEHGQIIDEPVSLTKRVLAS